MAELASELRGCGGNSVEYADNTTNFIGASNAFKSIDFKDILRRRNDELFMPKLYPSWFPMVMRLVGTPYCDDKVFLEASRSYWDDKMNSEECSWVW
ncbi:hypothetical protein NPIL_471 [Nephila pilipes]|uniref:Uncharacterized protein n=1 Tax=Nephila pilipes TaxID=299642 RepID=A0A8X6UN53_NEPPI|nr:hypothetical protein NPIL_471 [Nephila pilipes]